MITREQVADLQAGDVVQLRRSDWPDTVTTGPLRVERTGELVIADLVLRWLDGSVPAWARDHGHLTIISRAPRPLYVNHPRTEPVAGDVVRDADSDVPDMRTWMRCTFPSFDVWVNQSGRAARDDAAIDMPERLRLLVDGETGQVVQ